MPCQAAAHCWHCHAEGGLPFSFSSLPTQGREARPGLMLGTHPRVRLPDSLHSTSPGSQTPVSFSCPPCHLSAPWPSQQTCSSQQAPRTPPNPQAAAEPKLTRTHQHFPTGPPGEESTPQTLTCECTREEEEPPLWDNPAPLPHVCSSSADS